LHDPVCSLNFVQVLGCDEVGCVLETKDAEAEERCAIFRSVRN
jgi:hypothetical protein